MSTHFKLIMLFLVLFFVSSRSEAAGLSTAFSVVTLDGLEAGKTYSARQTTGLSLSVVNTGKEPVDLKIEVVLPASSELKDGYECLPDASWIELEKADFEDVGPNETATTDVFISIPDDQRYAGKKYQVFIWTHTTGRAIGVGLKSKLLLSIRGEKDE